MSRRFANVIGLRSEKVEEYKELHANIWPEIAEMISEFHISNYSIHLRRFPDGNHYLFSYFEYDGDDFESDMDRMISRPETMEWLSRCEACQQPLSDAGPDEWWSPLEEVFRHD